MVQKVDSGATKLKDTIVELKGKMDEHKSSCAEIKDKRGNSIDVTSLSRGALNERFPESKMNTPEPVQPTSNNTAESSGEPPKEDNV